MRKPTGVRISTRDSGRLFFVRFLTEPGQLVVDPFAGSNVTGQVAESLGRHWLSVEVNADYVAGSRLRFAEADALVAP